MGPNDVIAPLSIRLLGPFELSLNGRPVSGLRFRKGQAALAVLALRQGRAVEREWLAGLLWPDSREEEALHNLRNSLTVLRRGLGPEAHRLHSPSFRTLALDLTGAFVDALAFDAAVACGEPRTLEEAVALYRGPLLEGCTEEWVVQERRDREQAYLAARESLAGQALAHGDPAGAERHLRAVLAADPLREQTQRALMEVLAANGNYAAVVVAYRELRERLHREVNAEPDPATRALFERLRAEARNKAGAGRQTAEVRNGQHVSASPAAREWASSPPEHGADRGPTPGSPEAPCFNGAGTPGLCELPPEAARKSAALSSNLPSQLTSFVGRQAEMVEIRQQLASHRLVTLTGMGGCGKTRLALEVASGLAPAYPHGLCLVEFAPLGDPALVPQGVAAALRLREQPDRPLLETLVEALRPKPVLLLLDNCEHLVAACAQLADALLRSCPLLRILATSRELLGIAGEQPYRVPTLSLPDEGPGLRGEGQWLMADGPARSPSTINHQPSSLMQSEAVRLFVQRAATARPGFALTAENATVVAQVCCRLEGIPLALELAAGRLRALPVETLSQRLNDVFGVLTGGCRTALPRHQTLRALIDWSYDLLTPAEQALLRRLSVFAGDCSLEVAEAVCSDGGEGSRQKAGGSPDERSLLPTAFCLLPADILDLLTSLVDKSLVIYEERRGEGRYHLLELVREYGWAQLAAKDGTEALRERHAHFFLALAERAEPELARQDQGRWLDRLEREHNNLRAALAWSLESGESELGLRLCSALEPFWIPRGHVKEGRAQLLRLLAEPGAAAPTAVRARALSTAGGLTSLQGDIEISRALLEESLALWRLLEDRAGIATVLLRLGWFTWDRWEYATACRLGEECLVLRRELGEPGGIADALTFVARLRGEAGDPTARALLEESIAIWQALGDRISALRGLTNLARWALGKNDLDAARRLYEEVLAAATELGDRPRIGWALFGLGVVAQVQKDYPTARTFFERSLLLWRELDDHSGLIDTLTFLGFMLKEQGDAAAAYELFAELLAKAREVKRPGSVVEALALMGAAAGDLGRREESAAHCAESLRLTRPEREAQQDSITWNLTSVARVALARGRPARAARLLGAAEARLGPVEPARRRALDAAASAARAQMEAAEFESAWSAGQALPPEPAVAFALQEALAG